MKKFGIKICEYKADGEAYVEFDKYEKLLEAYRKQAKEMKRFEEINARFRNAIIKTSFCNGFTLVRDIERQHKAAHPQKESEG